MIAKSLAAEAAREIERLLGADATQTLGDFEAAETAVRTAVLAVAARFVAERLNADHSDRHAAGLPCRCGHTARYAGRRAKTIRTALGAMTIERAYYHCASCRTGFCPRDRTLGIDETTLSPAATRMTAAAARVSFKEASTLLDELAGLAVDPKQVERTAEALGRMIAADERQAVEPEAHRVKLRWSRFFGPLAKVYSRISGRHWNDDETATPVHSELQEAGGARGAAGGPPRAGDRGQARNPSEPGGRLEAPGGRRVGGCLRRQQSIARVGARDDDPRLAREDRRVDGGAGFFSARLPTLSRAARLELIERDGALSIRRQCALLGISRSSVYYTPRAESAANLALMRRMDALSLQYPFYGSRQMARHLRREGVLVGRRRVRRLMRLMGLEALYRRPRTSGSQPGHRIYPYLLRDLTIDRPDQVWCADITYIPVTAGFLYLVAIMDWASRHVLSWRLSNTMDTGFCVEALEAALRTGTPDIFNTDQGTARFR